MARTNKYNSLNFNDIYEKQKINNSTTRSNPSSSSNKTLISNSRIHGNMLVLTRPSPKPIVPPRRPSPPPATTTQPPPDQAQPPPVEPDSISLRPLGRTGPALHRIQGNKDLPDLPKTNRFVPPHLRPGFHGREEKPEPEVSKQTGFGIRSGNIRQGLLGAPVEEGRPKSGGGYYEGNRRMNRPGSIGSGRPYSSG